MENKKGFYWNLEQKAAQAQEEKSEAFRAGLRAIGKDAEERSEELKGILDKAMTAHEQRDLEEKRQREKLAQEKLAQEMRAADRKKYGLNDYNNPELNASMKALTRNVCKSANRTKEFLGE